MPVHVDVLVPTTRPSVDAARRSAERSLLASDDVVLHFLLQPDPDRRGPAWARNQAAAAGTSPYLALLDDDDLWLPGRLHRALQILADRPEVALVCGEALPAEGGLFLAGDPRGSGRPVTIEPGDHSHADLVADCFVAASTVTLRRADWEAAGGMPEDLPRAEDYALWLRLTRGGRPVHVLPDALARLRATDTPEAGLSSHPDAPSDTLRALTAHADPAALDSPAGRARRAALHAASVRSDPSHAPSALRLAPHSPRVWRSVLGGLIPRRPRR